MPSLIKDKIAELTTLTSQQIFADYREADRYVVPRIDRAISDMKIPVDGIKANRLIDTIIEVAYVQVKK